MRFVIPAGRARLYAAAVAGVLVLGWLSGFGPTSAGRVQVSALASGPPPGARPSVRPRRTRPVVPAVNCHVAKCVALTFDDGPGPYTAQVLAELRSLHVRATFFVIGRNAKQSPEMVRALRAAGMVVGNHSWSHPRMTKLSLAKQRTQIRRTQALLEATIGQRPRFFRPPMWAWNRTTARAVAEEGMVGVLFSVDTRDWSKPGVTAIVRQALTAHAGQIIALHDAGGDREQTVQALPLIVKGLRARGLEPVTLDELFRKSPS
jgi:peptidoglycan-N-acetylglucosamine deacetylase